MKHPMIGTKLSTSNIEFQEQFVRLPLAIQNGLNEGRYKLVDYIIYATKLVDGRTGFDIIEASDKPKEGIRNINGAQLDAGNYFMLKKIRFQSASITVEDNATPTEVQVASADFTGSLSPTIANGELGLSVNGSVVIPRSSNQIFVTKDSPLKGLYELDNAQLIPPLATITPNIRFGSNPDTATQKFVVRLELHGSIVVAA